MRDKKSMRCEIKNCEMENARCEIKNNKVWFDGE